MTNDTIGIDISKDHLDAHRLSDGASRRFANDSRGHKAFMSWLSPSRLDPPGVRIVYEPTGPYHRAFERKLAAAGLALVKGNCQEFCARGRFRHWLTNLSPKTTANWV
ncbi:hypothetical protein NKJ87_33645, partial [Mesorhizobium sp. M0027]